MFPDDEITGVGFGESRKTELTPLVPERETFSRERFSEWVTELMQRRIYGGAK